MTDTTDPTTEGSAAATITDEQLLDLYMTAWVAGGVDLTVATLPRFAADHLIGCAGCTQTTVDRLSARLTRFWEDPAARQEIISVGRAVLAREHRDPKFFHVARTAGDR